MNNMKFTPINKAQFEKRIEKAMFAAQEQIRTDTNEFVKADQWNLAESQDIKQDGLKIEVTWETPYAKRQYYTGKPSTDENPKASLQWAQKGADKHKDEWAKIIEKGLS